ncbi:uncharacterized protein LOC135952245 [Calliphora vicina]|uniref:uncharacterized protein LOC135952245 n=1 Tax=Calliphora vicina TaxID=7373 RepID=UPI00325A6CE0
MSGDQVLQNTLLLSEKTAEHTETSNNLEKSRTPKNIIVKVNGLQIQSNLNPNALEFIPINLQNKPQIQLNEELRKLILKNGIDGKFTQEKSFKKQEHFINDNEPIVSKNIESIGNKQVSKNITRAEPIEENERTNANGHEKIDLNIDTNQLYMLFARPSEVKHTSSETEISEDNDIQPENTIIDKKINLIHNESEIEVNDLNTEENTCLHENVLKITDDINELLEVHPENVNKSNGNIKECIISPTDKTNSGDDIDILELKSEQPQLYENVLELCEQTNHEVQNIKETNIAGIINETPVEVNAENANNTNEIVQKSKTSFIDKTEIIESKYKNPQINDNLLESVEHKKPKVQNIKESNNAGVEKTSTCGRPKNIKISQEVKVAKTKLNVNSKIAAPQVLKTGTIKKPGLSTKPINEVKECKQLNAAVESGKETKLKTPTIVQCTKLAKSVKNHLITKTTTNFKSHTLPANKPTLQPFKKEVINSVNKDTISNRSSSSTDKSSPSIKSSTQGCRVKSNEKPKTKEYVPKSPRPTLSSKLRKTETQKVS